MDHALLVLMKLRVRASLRRIRRTFKTPRKALLYCVGLLVVVLWFMPNVFLASKGVRTDPEQVRLVFPLALLGLCALTIATSVGERAIYFSPAEVAFLFSAPFGRRELLAYKMAGSVAGVTFSAFIFSVVFMRHTSSWLAGYVGMFLAFVFIQFLTTTLLMLSQTISESAYTRSRKIVFGVLVALLASAAWRVSASNGHFSVVELARAAHDSPAVRWLFLPLAPFANIITAERFYPDFLLGCGAALGINGLLFAVLIGVDAEYRETAVAVSQRIYDRIQRAQRTGIGGRTRISARWRIPMFRWRRGASPIAWRQMLNMLRSLRSLVMMFVFMGVVMVPMFLSHSEEQGSNIAVFTSLMVWLTFMLSISIRFDFRAELDNLEWLKMMPVSPRALACGELVVPVLLATLIQCIPCGVLAYSLKRIDVFVACAAFLIPANTLLFGVENVLFLLFPARVMRLSLGNLQVFGRQLLSMVAKFVIVAAGMGVAYAFGCATYYVSGSHALSTCVAWVTLALEAAAIVPVIAWAYRRFDVSLDMPA